MNCTTKSLKIIKNTFINFLYSPPRFVDQIFLDRTRANETKERVSYDKSCFLGCEDCSAKAKERKKKKKRKKRRREEKKGKEENNEGTSGIRNERAFDVVGRSPPRRR